MRNEPFIGEKFPVSEFTHSDIGAYIRFPWKSKEGQLHLIVTGELRQIYYNQGEIHLNLVGITHEYGDLEEFTFPSGFEVEIVDPKEPGLI
jgi:hypothetical protein